MSAEHDNELMDRARAAEARHGFPLSEAEIAEELRGVWLAGYASGRYGSPSVTRTYGEPFDKLPQDCGHGSTRTLDGRCEICGGRP